MRSGGLMGTAALALLAAPAWAQSASSGDGDSFLGGEWQPVDPAELEQMRGGFEMPSGLNVSFGIERAVYVNGDLVANTVLNIPDIAAITPEQAAQVADFNRGRVVQIGEGNVVMPAQMAGALVVQNTLDNQTITTLTRIDVAVDSVATLQAINFSNLISDALAGSVSP
ncbi:hypothetical protein ABB29_05290 [Pseudoxanthomonas dokdonensis]|uniref:Uncharacterized protein n=2 Tax=Pseudoxanthomonas dokdonensis TaxID=344882 RepID=A0A0R0CXG4_9GAMM|nr:hypothetical protein ABB29_05290 [Pseudoxanthomonas dokdonensis]